MKFPAPTVTNRLGAALFRVSTDRQFQEDESIDTQNRRSEILAQRSNIDVVRIFTEHYSGRSSARQTIEEMFRFLADNSDIEVLIVGDIDRFTRGGAQVYLELKRRLADLNVQLLDATGVVQPERNRLEHLGFEYNWSMESPSRPTEIFMAEKARAEVSDLLTRMIGQEINLSLQGYHCRLAPFGYRILKVMDAEGKKKPTLVPEPAEAKFVRQMFEWRAAGTLSDQEICDRINAQGFRTRAYNRHDQTSRKIIGTVGNNPLSPKQLQRTIAQPLYAGVKIERWTHHEPVKMRGEPLVSLGLFNQANLGKIVIEALPNDQYRLLKNPKTYGNHRHNPEFLLRHVVICPTCGKPLHASKSTGKSGERFAYYHCRRHKPAFSKSKAEFEETVAKYLEGVTGKPGFLPLLKEVVREVWLKKNQQTDNHVEDVDRHANDLKIRQSQLLDKLTISSSPIVTKKLEEQIEDIETTLNDLKDQAPHRPLARDEIAQYFAIVKETFEHPSKLVQKATTKGELDRIWSLIFAQNPTFDDLHLRTPDLTLIYRLQRDCDGDKGRMVSELALTWNTFESQLRSALLAHQP